MQAWEAHDPTLTRPIAAPLEQCAELPPQVSGVEEFSLLAQLAIPPPPTSYRESVCGPLGGFGAA
jgi:hypothetical protein